MKNKIILIALSIGLFTTVSCKKDDDNSSDSIQKQVQTNVQSGTWRITKFIDSGNNETSNFSGYDFKFNANGVLNATNGSNDYNGIWNITDSNSNDDTQDDLDFNIFFSQGNNFEDLNDDWHFISQSSTKIELIDVSGGGGGTDYLTFEKN